MEPYLGQICFFAFPYTITGWLPCDGRLLQISQYQALFSLLGSIYGGDGHTTFALPDLRGRVPVGLNQSNTANRIPTTTAGASGGGNTITIPPSQTTVGVTFTTAMSPDIKPVQGQAGPTQVPLPPPPYLGLNACICVEGIYPQRD